MTTRDQLLTFADVMRFFDAKATIRACPSCASHKWTLQHGRLSDKPELIFSTNTLGVGVPLEMSSGKEHAVQNLPFGRPVLPMICDECGFMKIHDYAVVKRWVDANPAEAANAPG